MPKYIYMSQMRLVNHTFRFRALGDWINQTTDDLFADKKVVLTLKETVTFGPPQAVSENEVHFVLSGNTSMFAHELEKLEWETKEMKKRRKRRLSWRLKNLCLMVRARRREYTLLCLVLWSWPKARA